MSDEKEMINFVMAGTGAEGRPASMSMSKERYDRIFPKALRDAWERDEMTEGQGGIGRFILFDFPDYETADIEAGIIGTCTSLDSVLEQVYYSGSLQALYTQTGDMWEYFPREWKKISNVGSKPRFN